MLKSFGDRNYFSKCGCIYSLIILLPTTHTGDLNYKGKWTYSVSDSLGRLQRFCDISKVFSSNMATKLAICNYSHSLKMQDTTFNSLSFSATVLLIEREVKYHIQPQDFVNLIEDPTLIRGGGILSTLRRQYERIVLSS